MREKVKPACGRGGRAKGGREGGQNQHLIGERVKPVLVRHEIDLQAHHLRLPAANIPPPITTNTKQHIGTEHALEHTEPLSPCATFTVAVHSS